MEQLSLDNFKKKISSQPDNTTPGTEWRYWVQQFEKELNPPRIEAGYKPLPPARIASLIKPFKNDMYYFYEKCKRAKSFTKTFWWHAKPK